MGGWLADKAADREIVARLSGRVYEHVERDLRHLARLDDPPILQFGDVWRAKSPLELLDLFGDRITSDELDRFFTIAREVLVAPDPALELPDEQRYAAQIYGKVRPESGLLIHSLCDTLMKLAVRGSQVASLAASQIEVRISVFVRDLLDDSDGAVWLSLSSVLPDLAEAAPETFLKSAEISLRKPSQPVLRLLTETSSSGIMGRCWHAGLLWALERLAWAPERLGRVSLLLAHLSHIEIKGNWGNSPKRTLLSLFRAWCPQTAATVDQRIAVLDLLIRNEPDIAFDLLHRLTHVGHDIAIPSARPIWRDEDAGAGRGVSEEEQHRMLIAGADRLIACAKGDAGRVARLLEKINILDPPRVSATLKLAGEFAEPDIADDDKEIVRRALRKKIHWYRNYSDLRGAALESKLSRIADLYDELTPADLVFCHAWLFASDPPELPIRVRDEKYLERSRMIELWRKRALEEIYAATGFAGIETLAKTCTNSAYVGVILAEMAIADDTLVEWVVRDGGDFTAREHIRMTIRGLLRAFTPSRSAAVVNAVIERSKRQGSDTETVVQFLTLAREEQTTWEIATSLGCEVENGYWAICAPGFWLRDDEVGFEFALRRLLKAGRPRSALQVCQLDIEKVDPELLAEMLERISRGEESEGVFLDPYYIGEAINQLERATAIERGRLARLEFGLIPALGFEGEHRAKSLNAAVMSDPKIFTELLCLAYKPANSEPKGPMTEQTKAAAQVAWQILRSCRRQPATGDEGHADPGAFTRFIDDTRELCQQADRLAVCDLTLGQILAHAPANSDGTWPFDLARNVLDRPELEDMRRGFLMGVLNKRGVTSRALDEGGQQERGLALKYKGYARMIDNSHTNVAAVLNEIAASYERDASREDLQSRLLREGH